MTKLPFRGLLFQNLLERDLHVQVRRRDGRLTVTIWSRQPNQGERHKTGIQTLNITAKSDRLIEANEFRGPIVIESADRLPCDLVYAGFERVKRDLVGCLSYEPVSGIITLALKPYAN